MVVELRRGEPKQEFLQMAGGRAFLHFFILFENCLNLAHRSRPHFCPVKTAEPNTQANLIN